MMPADEGLDQPTNPSNANRNNSRDSLPQTGRRLSSPTLGEPPPTRSNLSRSASPTSRREVSSSSVLLQIPLPPSPAQHQVGENLASSFRPAFDQRRSTRLASPRPWTPRPSTAARSHVVLSPIFIEHQSEEKFAPVFESSESEEEREQTVEDGSDVVRDSKFPSNSLSSSRISQVIRSNDVTTVARQALFNQSQQKRHNSYSADSHIAWVTDTLFPPAETSYDMIFSERRAADRRRALSATSAPTPYEADLTSKDRTRQKEAIRKTLEGKIKDDWDFNWPRKEGDPEPAVVDEQSTESSDLKWTDRDEWLSDVSDDEVESSGSIKPDVANDSSATHHGHPGPHLNIFNHEPASRKVDRRKARHRKKFREECAWNEGLRCYSVRRDLWTGARYVRRTHKAASKSNAQPAPSSDEPADELDLDTELPIAPPILPPETLMRRSLTEKAYPTIYDKVIVQSQTPYCPINLSVIVRSCVDGWKRDGEWPPKSGEVEAAIARKTPAALKITTRSSATGGEDKDGGTTVKDKGVFRRSLQKVFGVVHSGNGTKIKEAE